MQERNYNDSLNIMYWGAAQKNLHDFMVSHDFINLVKSFPYILADSVYYLIKWGKSAYNLILMINTEAGDNPQGR